MLSSDPFVSSLSAADIDSDSRLINTSASSLPASSAALLDSFFQSNRSTSKPYNMLCTKGPMPIPANSPVTSH